MKTKIQSINFSIGDFALVRVAGKKGHKLGFHWRGPRRISNIMNDLVYGVKNLSDGTKEIVHATTILLYRAELDNLEVDPNLIAHAEHSDALYQDVTGFRGVEQRGSHFLLQVEWTELPDENEWS